MAENKPDQSSQGPAFWKFAAAGASFQAGSSAVDSATVVATLVIHLTGNVYAVGAASAILRLGWLSTQLIVGFLAQRSQRRMPYYVVGAYGRATCLLAIAILFALANEGSDFWIAVGFLLLWTLYAFVSGIVAVPYNDIVARAIPSDARSRLLAWRFFGGGILALGVAAIVHRLLSEGVVLTAYAWIFALAAALMYLSSFCFVSAGEPPIPESTASTAESDGFIAFLRDGLDTFLSDDRFRIFFYTQWLAGATLMALPFYVVAATSIGLSLADVGILLAAQTAGSLSSNALWGHVGDRFGKLRLLQSVSVLRIAVPLGMIAILLNENWTHQELLLLCAVLFFAVGALVNGMTIGYLGYLMEISPNERRPAYSAYFNTLASPAALLPLVGAAIADVLSLAAVFVVAASAALFQIYLFVRLANWKLE